MIQNLKLLREKHGVTQQRLAAAVGVSQQSINKYENHDVEPDISTLIAIADFFHTSVDYLIGHIFTYEEPSESMTLNKTEAKMLWSYRNLSDKERESIHLILENYLK